MDLIWNGPVSLRDDDLTESHDIELLGGEQCLKLPVEAKLSLLTFVDRAKIPLHIICGPRYQVFSRRSWIEEALLDTFPKDDSGYLYTDGSRGSPESAAGALLRVEEESSSEKIKNSAKITELLLYASVNQQFDLTESLGPIEVEFYALPLSSHLLYQPNLYRLPTPPPEEHTAEILGTLLQPPDHYGSKKRQRLNTLFEDATKPRKKPKRQESQDLTRLVPSRPQSPALVQAPISQSQSVPLSAKRSHSRTQSLSSAIDERPRSRGLERARSSLSRVASTGLLSRPDSRGGDTTATQADIDEPTTAIETKNKKILSNLVMASMRLRGMSQQKRKDLGSTSASAQGPDPDIEYKLMYHNTFKAANFALRGTIKEKALSSESMRDVVDLLLDLFCGNEDGGGGNESGGFGMSH